MTSSEMAKIAPFDLIIANILAGPLWEMSTDIVAKIQPSGHLILSGILNTQAEYVKEPYLKLGMHMIDQFQRNDWTILIMQKNSPNPEFGIKKV
jgi:ribosomal protein L11 methyltransferase